jgi:NADH-quinone oxidoreductase subunit L
MLILVFLITLLVHLYSTEYMKDDPSFIKFMTYLSLFSFYMMVLVSAGNMLILFLG